MGFLQDIVADARPREPAPAAAVESPELRPGAGAGAESAVGAAAREPSPATPTGSEAGRTGGDETFAAPAETPASEAAIDTARPEEPLVAAETAGPPLSMEPGETAAETVAESVAEPPAGPTFEVAIEEPGTPEAITSEPSAPPAPTRATLDAENGTDIGRDEPPGESSAMPTDLAAAAGAEPSPSRPQAPVRPVPSPPMPAAPQDSVSTPAEADPPPRVAAAPENGRPAPRTAAIGAPSSDPAPGVEATGDESVAAAAAPAALAGGKAAVETRTAAGEPSEGPRSTETAPAAAGSAPSDAPRQTPRVATPPTAGDPLRTPGSQDPPATEPAAVPGTVTPVRVSRPEARSREPRIHIGQIDVVVTAPPAASGHPRERQAPRALASRHYLRTL